MEKKSVLVVGATGQIGTTLTKALLRLGHDVKALVRSRDEKNEVKLRLYESFGAKVEVASSNNDVEELAQSMQGYDTVVICTPANEYTISTLGPIYLEAALKAGVKRFVPNEFGTHTRGIEFGAGILFDYKKKLQEKIIASGINYTFFYNAGIFDYFLPNLRFFDGIVTFGNLQNPIYTHHIDDIGLVAALSITDERTVNKCVQMDYNAISQEKMLELVKTFWSGIEFKHTHYDEEYITKMKHESTDEISAKQGKETDRERWGINYVNYVLCKLASFTDETLRASELFPQVVCKRPEEVIADKNFMFENTK